MKKIIIPILTFALFSVFALVLLILSWPQNNPFETVKIEIPRGASLAEITRELTDRQILSSPRTFILAARTMGYETEIPAGTYQLRDAFTNKSILTQLVKGKPLLHRITVLEGWTAAQVADEVSARLEIDANEFKGYCQDPLIASRLQVPGESLEGFLFPETYYFPAGEPVLNVIETMVREYHKIMTTDMLARAAELGFSELELVTLASIIEGEAIYNSERPIVSGVYHNRLNRGMKLQADPTIQYIIADSPRRLLNRDLQIDSPYNTYLNYGLPPGPINNPGKESIYAALYPENNDYLYFVARGDGYHRFSMTSEEHNQAKLLFQKVRHKARKTTHDNEG